MSQFIYANNAFTTLAQALSPSTTTINLAAGTGALFPNPAAGQQFALTLNDALTGLVYEICWCTSRTGDQLTVLRGQEGTAATTWQIGDSAYNALTAGSIGIYTVFTVTNSSGIIHCRKSPDGLIEQYGVVYAPSNGSSETTLFTLPISYTVSHDFCLANFGGTAPPAGNAVGEPYSLTQMAITVASTIVGNQTVSFMSRGY